MNRKIMKFQHTKLKNKDFLNKIIIYARYKYQNEENENISCCSIDLRTRFYIRFINNRKLDLLRDIE